MPAIGRVRDLDQSLGRVRHARLRLNALPVWVPIAFCVSFHAAALMMVPAYPAGRGLSLGDAHIPAMQALNVLCVARAG